MEKCEICGKKSNYNGLVYYNNTGERHLCKSHYLKFCRSKLMIKLNKKYKKAKPQTQQWYDMCRKKGEAFNEWFKKQKKESNRNSSKQKLPVKKIKQAMTEVKDGMGLTKKEVFGKRSVKVELKTLLYRFGCEIRDGALLMPTLHKYLDKSKGKFSLAKPLKQRIK